MYELIFDVFVVMWYLWALVGWLISCAFIGYLMPMGEDTEDKLEMDWFKYPEYTQNVNSATVWNILIHTSLVQ